MACLVLAALGIALAQVAGDGLIITYSQPPGLNRLTDQFSSLVEFSTSEKCSRIWHEDFSWKKNVDLTLSKNYMYLQCNNILSIHTDWYTSIHSAYVWYPAAVTWPVCPSSPPEFVWATRKEPEECRGKIKAEMMMILGVGFNGFWLQYIDQHSGAWRFLSLKEVLVFSSITAVTELVSVLTCFVDQEGEMGTLWISFPARIRRCMQLSISWRMRERLPQSKPCESFLQNKDSLMSFVSKIWLHSLSFDWGWNS